MNIVSLQSSIYCKIETSIPDKIGRNASNVTRVGGDNGCTKLFRCLIIRGDL